MHDTRTYTDYSGAKTSGLEKYDCVKDKWRGRNVGAGQYCSIAKPLRQSSKDIILLQHYILPFILAFKVHSAVLLVQHSVTLTQRWLDNITLLISFAAANRDHLQHAVTFVLLKGQITTRTQCSPA